MGTVTSALNSYLVPTGVGAGAAATAGATITGTGTTLSKTGLLGSTGSTSFDVTAEDVSFAKTLTAGFFGGTLAQDQHDYFMQTLAFASASQRTEIFGNLPLDSAKIQAILSMAEQLKQQILASQGGTPGGFSSYDPNQIPTISSNMSVHPSFFVNPPRQVRIDGRLYTFTGTPSNTLVYKNSSAPNGKRTAYLRKGTTSSYNWLDSRQVLVGTTQVQTGLEKVKVGTEKKLVGYDTQVTKIPYTEDVITGYKDVITGYDKVTRTVEDGTEQIKVGTRISGYTSNVTSRTLFIGREVDQLLNAGLLGELTNGDGDWDNDGDIDSADASAFNNRADQFLSGQKGQDSRISSLLGEDNCLTPGSTSLLKDELEQGNDSGLAGDPQVFGKATGYQTHDHTPAVSSGQGEFFTVFEDGVDGQRKLTVNNHAQVINDQGNVAFTEYGLIVQDDAGQKTSVRLSGGQVTVTNPDGSQRTLAPGETFTVGDANDPVAKLSFASRPGGENGQSEQRFVLEMFEKPTEASVQELIAAGVSEDHARGLRRRTEFNAAFRLPDGQGSFRMPQGVGNGSPISQSNNVKTYYDVHMVEGPGSEYVVNKDCPTPIYEDVFETRTKYKQICEEVPRTEKQPITETVTKYREETTQVPRYEDCDIFEDRPVYSPQKMYKTVYTPRNGEATQLTYNLGSPLVIDLDSNGIQTSNQDTVFDINGDGELDVTGWVSGKDGLLVFDADGDGKVGESALELLGNATSLNGTTAGDFSNGFEALKELAKKHLGEAAISDNWLDASEIASLNTKTGFGIVTEGQYKSLSALNINGINLHYQSVNESSNGNPIYQKSTVNRSNADGTTTQLTNADVWFQFHGYDSNPPAQTPPVYDSPASYIPPVYGNPYSSPNPYAPSMGSGQLQMLVRQLLSRFLPQLLMMLFSNSGMGGGFAQQYGQQYGPRRSNNRFGW